MLTSYMSQNCIIARRADMSFDIVRRPYGDDLGGQTALALLPALAETTLFTGVRYDNPNGKTFCPLSSYPPNRDALT